MLTNHVRSTLQCSQAGEDMAPGSFVLQGLLNPRRGQSWETQVRGILRSKTKTEHGVAKARGSKCSHCPLLTGLVVLSIIQSVNNKKGYSCTNCNTHRMCTGRYVYMTMHILTKNII